MKYKIYLIEFIHGDRPPIKEKKLIKANDGLEAYLKATEGLRDVSLVNITILEVIG